MIKRSIVIAVSTAFLGFGCAAPGSGPRLEHGLETAALGAAHLVLSPVMVVAGLLEGIAALPYFLGTGVHELNAGLRDAQAQVDLDTTYRHAYGTPLEQVPADGSTGRVFRDMDAATVHFRRVLRGYGVAEADRYLLTAVRSADRDGYTLYAVVYRAADTPAVTGRQAAPLTPRERAYYRPYPQDAGGRALDTVVDWAGVPRSAIRTQKGQAILLTLAANSVLINRRSDDYWSVERRWLDGAYREVVAERKMYLDARLGLPG
jgi:hypothetical protein